MGALLGDDVVEAGPGDLVLQAAQPVAHLLERGRRAVPDPGDHLAGRLRALLPRAVRPGRRHRGRPGGAGAAERALRPRDAAGERARAARALRPADGRAALRRLAPVRRRPAVRRPTARAWAAGPGSEAATEAGNHRRQRRPEYLAVVTAPPTTRTRRAFCSALSSESGEPLAATASRVDHWILVEYRGGVGARPARREPFSPEVKEHLSAQARGACRTRGCCSSGSRGARRTRRTARSSRTSRPGEERLRRARGRASARPARRRLRRRARRRRAAVEEPMYLVCTHGKRDRCCALHGRPVYDALRHETDPARVWQSTHVGGDRFAGNVVVLPHGLYYGRVAPADARRVLAATSAGKVELERYRGRSAYPFRVQAAEQALRESEGLIGIDDLELVGTARGDDGTWRVRFRTPDAAVHELRRRRVARGRADVPDVRLGRAPPRPPLAGHGARASSALIRRKPSRTSRRASTSRPSASSSPGGRRARNGSSLSKHARTSAAACAGKRISLALEEQRRRRRRRLLEVGDHGLPPLEQRVGVEARRARAAARGRPRGSAAATGRTAGAAAARPARDRAVRAIRSASPSSSPLVDAAAERELVLAGVERALGGVVPRVHADADREVQRVGRRRLGLVEPAAREVERVAGLEHEVVARLAVLAERRRVALVLERQLEQRVVDQPALLAGHLEDQHVVRVVVHREALRVARRVVRVRLDAVAERLLERAAEDRERVPADVQRLEHDRRAGLPLRRAGAARRPCP